MASCSKTRQPKSRVPSAHRHSMRARSPIIILAQVRYETAIADEGQNVLVRNPYDRHWLTRENFGNGEIHSYDYVSSDGPCASSITVTLPDGTRTLVKIASSVPEARKHPPH